ncbi:MAG: tyrosine-type recombinase/integrase [Rectinema subterraneum]|uniref:tyrosine-type recombinase/integrase n=1 Tax=Rectinema subterraneum TaxID=2653714 RepID=UPI003C7A737A
MLWEEMRRRDLPGVFLPEALDRKYPGLSKDGYDIRTIQELLGHSNVQTTMIYTRVAMRNKRGVRSPLENL